MKPQHLHGEKIASMSKRVPLKAREELSNNVSFDMTPIVFVSKRVVNYVLKGQEDSTKTMTR